MPRSFFSIFIVGIISVQCPAFAEMCDSACVFTALQKLYNTTGGYNWSRKNNWLSTLPVGQWQGVRKISSVVGGPYYSITLEKNNLVGTLPSDMVFPNLWHLRIGGNKGLTGEIPSAMIGNSPHLKRLSIREASFTGTLPANFFNLSSLESFEATNVAFSGTIPTEFGNLSELKILDFDKAFHGTIPESIFGLTKLEELAICHNPNITGVLSEKIGQLVNLKKLAMDSNSLTGMIPTTIFQLTNLEKVELQSNFFEGPIPFTIGESTSLKDLRLGNNNLEGTIPQALFGLSYLERIDIKRNFALSGSIHESVSDLANLQILDVSNCDLYGPLPTLSKILTPTYIDFSENFFSQSIPRNFLGSANSSSFIKVDLKSNLLTGVVPSSLSRLDYVDLNIIENYFVHISESICSKSGWMDGLVGEFGCNAIACSRKSQNKLGRQLDSITPCEECNTACYVGGRSCGVGNNCPNLIFTETPTFLPTQAPTMFPTMFPTVPLTNFPSTNPTKITSSPTQRFSSTPSSFPTVSPQTEQPVTTASPSIFPTDISSSYPTGETKTGSPTIAPSDVIDLRNAIISGPPTTSRIDTISMPSYTPADLDLKNVIPRSNTFSFSVINTCSLFAICTVKVLF